MFMPKWSAKLEYLYADLGSSFAYAVPATVQNDYLRFSMVRGGINYHF
jgi:opacity protein-like surface antigen